MRIWGNDYNKMEFAGAFGDPDQYFYRWDSHVPWSKRHGRPHPVWRKDTRSADDSWCNRAPYGSFLKRLGTPPLKRSALQGAP
jgi:hypothetical protein